MSTYKFRSYEGQARAIETIGLKGKGKELLAFTGRCALVSVTVRNLSGSDRQPQIFDLGAAPADGSTPDMVPLPVAPNDAYSFKPSKPREHKNGIYVCSSSTIDTKTLTGSDDMMIEVEYMDLTNVGA